MTSQQESERVRSYLLSQGERNSFVAMWPRAVKTRLQVMDALEALTDAQAAFKPAADDWSIREVALHLIDSSGNTRRLVERLAGGRRGDAGGVETARVETAAPIEELRARLLADSVAWSAMTERLPSEPPLEQMAPHPFFGALHCRAWYLFQRVHDLDHFNQIEAVKKAEGYPA